MNRYVLILVILVAVIWTLPNVGVGQTARLDSRPLPQDGTAFQKPEQAASNYNASTLQESNGTLILDPCGVLLIEDIELPAREAGQLVEMSVHEGDIVQRGQVVARIDDQLAQRTFEESTFRYDVANQKASDTIEIESARRVLQFMQDRYEKSRALYAKGNESEAKYNEAQTNLEVQRMKVASVEKEKALGAIEAKAEMVRVNAARDSIQRHELASPVNGAVFEVAKQASEWVNAGEKVLRIARMDRLRVKGFVPHTRFDPSQIANRRVTVKATLARGREVEFTGQVVFVALEKIGSEDFEVWAEVDNQMEDGFWQLLPGSNVRLIIHQNEPPLPPVNTSQVLQPVSNQPATIGNLNPRR